MTSGKRKLTQPLWSLARTRKYLQQLTSAFFTLPPHLPFLCSMNEISIQTQARWFFEMLVYHILGLLAFWIKLLFLAPKTCLLIYWHVACGKQYERGVGSINTPFMTSFQSSMWSDCAWWWQKGMLYLPWACRSQLCTPWDQAPFLLFPWHAFP